MPSLEVTPETAQKTFDLFRLLFTAGWGLAIIIIYFHASYNDQGSVFWAAFALVIPGIGFLVIDKLLHGASEFLVLLPIAVFVAYFSFFYMGGIERAARRAEVHAQQHWEFALTDKGIRKDPNLPEDESGGVSASRPGHRREVVAESPPSRESEAKIHPGHIKDIIAESPPSRDIEHEKGKSHDTPPPRLKKVIDESPPSRDIGGKG